MKKIILFFSLLFISLFGKAAVNLTQTGYFIPTQQYLGLPSTINITIKNTGTTSTSTTFTVNISLNSVGIYNGSQTYLTQLTVNGLAAGASITVSGTITIPCTYSTGFKYILLGINPAPRAVIESSYTDNEFGVSVFINSVPDLTPLAYTLSSYSLIAGNSVTANFAVNNAGGVFSGTHTAGFYLSTSSTLNTNSAIFLGTYTVLSIPACAQTILLSKVLTIPSYMCTGTYYLHLWVDNGQNVTEVNDNNNFQYYQISINGLSPPAPPTATFGDPSNPTFFSTSTTPNLTWSGSGTNFWVNISKCPYGASNIVYSADCISGNSYSIPSGNLLAGRLYRWNMYGGYACCVSGQSTLSNTRYFNIPPVIISNGNTTLCQGGSVQLSTDYYSDATYQWKLNGVDIPNANLNYFYAGSQGVYTVVNSFSCGSTSASNAITVTVQTCCTPPNLQANNITFSNIQSNQVTVNWNNGNGTKRIVKINNLLQFSVVPDGTDPVANNTYQGTFNQVVYNGNGNSVTVSNLSPNSTYYFNVTEGNCTGSSSVYLSAGAANNPSNVATPPIACITWQNGITPTNPLVLTAAEYLCQHNIIDNFQNVQDLLGFSLGQAAEVSISGLYNGIVPVSLPSDNLPSLVTDIQVLPFYQYQATKALCYLDGVDGRPCINRDYYTVQPKSTVSQGRVLRMLLEGWNIAPDTTGFDIYAHTPSSFLCNVLKDDANYGYFKKAYQLGLINDFISGGCFTYSSPGEFLYVILYKLHSQNSPPSITTSSFFEPNNFDPKNVSNETGIERAVFQTYEQSGFSLPSGGLGIDFDYSYHSSLLEYPTIAEDWQGRSYGNLENHKAALKNYPLGKGWTHSYNIYASILKWPNNSGVTVESAILFHWGDGSVYVYNISTNQFETKGIYDDFIIDGYDLEGLINAFRIVTKNKITFKFSRSNTQFYCTDIIDRNNNKTSLFYTLAECALPPATCVGSTNGRLDYVLDFASNRRLNFVYLPNSDLLSEVKDNIGRSIKLYPNKLTYNLDSSTNARGNNTIYKYCNGDTCNNMLIEIKRPKGNWIKNTYAKRKLKQTQTPNYSTSINFSTSYNPSSQTTSSIIQTTPTSGTNYTTTYQHNSLGQPTSITGVANAATIQYGDPLNPTLPTYVLDTKTSVATINSYDTKGNTLQSTITGGSISQTTQQWYNSNNDVIQTQLPNGSIFNTVYDVRGNVINETGPLGFSYQYARNNNGTINYKTNANNIVSRFGYNSFGNVNNVSIDNTTIQAEALYDSVSRITHVKDANSTISKYVHDNNDNIVQTIIDTSGLKLISNYNFDRNDNNDLVIAPKGDSTRLTFDQNDDLVREDYGNNFRVWAYHDDGSLKSYQNKNGHQFSQHYFNTGSGFEGLLEQKDGNTLEYYPATKLLKSTTRGSNKITFDYDALTRVNYVKLEVPNSSLISIVNYEYDVSGFQTKITIPAINKNYGYVPDSLNRIADIFDWNNNLLIHYNYRADGNLISEQLGNGVIISYHYDNGGRLDSIYGKKSNGTLLYAVGATLDNLGNHVKESYFVNKGSLPTITNQLNDSVVSYQYENTNRLQNTNTQPATNDNAGNILTNNYAGFTNGSYDFWEHLTSCNVDGRNFSFYYDPLNNRFRTDTALYIQDLLNNGNVLAERTTTNPTITNLFCHSPYGLVCSIDPNTNQKRWYLYDFRGSTVAIVDDNQNVVEYYKYEPFGQIEESSHIAGTTTKFLYVGKYGVEYHSPRLYYMRARCYDPTNGRFYGEDPVWGTNLFTYGDNNPITNIDADGRFAVLAIPLIPEIVVGAQALYASLVGVAALTTVQIIAKRNTEVERLRRRESDKTGVQYSLRAANSGVYPNVRGGNIYLNKNDVYKYGETTLSPNQRYTNSELSIGAGLDFKEEYRGNQIKAKIKEKTKIYKYYFKNGELPPGNKIFR
jgi:RHS repeat-associated protein